MCSLLNKRNNGSSSLSFFADRIVWTYVSFLEEDMSDHVMFWIKPINYKPLDLVQNSTIDIQFSFSTYTCYLLKSTSYPL